MNCIKICLPGKSILRDYFQENRTSRRPFLLLRISFPGRPIFIQLPPGGRSVPAGSAAARGSAQSPGGNCMKIGLPGKLILSKRKGLREVLFS